MSQMHLSKTDAGILAKVFGTEVASRKVDAAVLPVESTNNLRMGAELAQRLQTREQAAIVMVEGCEKTKPSVEALQAAYGGALQILDSLIAEYPNYASARNNRAQLRRWRYGDSNTICQSAHALNQERKEAGAAVICDLKTAIALASPVRAQGTVDAVEARLLAQAYTQLGAALLAAAKDLDAAPDMQVLHKSYEAWTAADFEEEASRLFRQGGLYGSEVALAMAVHTNPHAKLCGSIVQQAIYKEIENAGC